MKLLIFGARGMAGHMLYEYFSNRDEHEVWGTVRSDATSRHIFKADVRDHHRVERILARLRPDVVINCAGLLNDNAARNLAEAIHVNALFPHVLQDLSRRFGYRLLHISTDCVFSGQKGGYAEADETDGTSVYSRTKSLGEVMDDDNLTIRTSIIGPEQRPNGSGLFEWLMRQTGEVPGYRQVMWNGVTTLELARAIEWVLPRRIHGLIHLTAPAAVSKYQLLALIRDIFHRDDICLVPADEPKSDRTLVNTRADFQFATRPYSDMIADMKRFIERGN